MIEMKKTVLRLMLASSLLALCSCNGEPKGLSAESDSFEKRDAVGLVKGKNYLLLFNKTDSQFVYNFKRKYIRFQADDQTCYVNAFFRDYPKDLVEINDVLMVELTYKERSAVQEKKLTLPMILLKQQEQMYWLWNEEEKMGLIVDYELFGLTK